MFNAIHDWDQKCTHTISKRSLPAYLEIFLCYPGALLFGWVGMILIWPPVLYYLRGTNGVILLLSSAAIGQGINRLAKNIVQRDRPTPPSPSPVRHFPVRVPDRHATGDGPSFPSGDSMAAGVVGATIYFILATGGSSSWSSPPQLAFLLTLWGMIGRMYYHCHYFLDTIFGAMIGIASSLTAQRMRLLEPAEFIIAVPLFIVWMSVSKSLAKMVRRVFIESS